MLFVLSIVLIPATTFGGEPTVYKVARGDTVSALVRTATGNGRNWGRSGVRVFRLGPRGEQIPVVDKSQIWEGDIVEVDGKLVWPFRLRVWAFRLFVAFVIVLPMLLLCLRTICYRRLMQTHRRKFRLSLEGFVHWDTQSVAWGGSEFHPLFGRYVVRLKATLGDFPNLRSGAHDLQQELERIGEELENYPFYAQTPYEKGGWVCVPFVINLWRWCRECEIFWTRRRRMQHCGLVSDSDRGGHRAV